MDGNLCTSPGLTQEIQQWSVFLYRTYGFLAHAGFPTAMHVALMHWDTDGNHISTPTPCQMAVKQTSPPFSSPLLQPTVKQDGWQHISALRKCTNCLNSTSSILNTALSLHRFSFSFLFFMDHVFLSHCACLWEWPRNRQETAWCSVANELYCPVGNITCTWFSPRKLCPIR